MISQILKFDYTDCGKQDYLCNLLLICGIKMLLI
jgi:hypothetical protein